MQQDLEGEEGGGFDQAPRRRSIRPWPIRENRPAIRTHWTLSTADYQMQKARLEAAKQAIMSKIQGEESDIDSGLAEETLNVQKAANLTPQKSSEGKISSLTRARDTAKTPRWSSPSISCR